MVGARTLPRKVRRDAVDDHGARAAVGRTLFVKVAQRFALFLGVEARGHRSDDQTVAQEVSSDAYGLKEFAGCVHGSSQALCTPKGMSTLGMRD